MGLSCQLPGGIEVPPLTEWSCIPRPDGSWYCTADSAGTVVTKSLQHDEGMITRIFVQTAGNFQVGVANVASIEREWQPSVKDNLFTVRYNDNSTAVIWGRHVIVMWVAP